MSENENEGDSRWSKISACIIFVVLVAQLTSFVMAVVSHRFGAPDLSEKAKQSSNSSFQSSEMASEDKERSTVIADYWRYDAESRYLNAINTFDEFISKNNENSISEKNYCREHSKAVKPLINFADELSKAYSTGSPPYLEQEKSLFLKLDEAKSMTSILLKFCPDPRIGGDHVQLQYAIRMRNYLEYIKLFTIADERGVYTNEERYQKDLLEKNDSVFQYDIDMWSRIQKEDANRERVELPPITINKSPSMTISNTRCTSSFNNFTNKVDTDCRTSTI